MVIAEPSFLRSSNRTAGVPFSGCRTSRALRVRCRFAAPPPAVESRRRGWSVPVEGRRAVVVAVGVPERDGAEDPPALRHPERAEERRLAAEVPEEARAEPFVDRTQKDAHDPEGRIAPPVGDGPGRLAGAEGVVAGTRRCFGSGLGLV